MIISFTGHRDLGGFNIPSPIYNNVSERIEAKLIELKPTKILTGMAIGTDTLAANIAIKLNIPFDAIIPFNGQDQIWPEAAKKEYRRLLELASEKVVVSSGNFTAYKMQVRNEYLVDNCDKLIAVIRKDCIKGGTHNCIIYAIKQKKEIIYINPA